MNLVELVFDRVIALNARVLSAPWCSDEAIEAQQKSYASSVHQARSTISIETLSIILGEPHA